MKVERQAVTPLIDPNLALIRVAQGFVGIREEGGDNKGEMVEAFQKAVDGKARGESWCLSFLQYCAGEVCKQLPDAKNSLYKTEHCLTLWNNTDPKSRSYSPKVGWLVVWRFGDTTSGHVGLVTSVTRDFLHTVEGNTSDGEGINREGNGVYERQRATTGSSTFRIMGYVNPFG